MRLQREARAAFKDVQTAIKKTGKISDNFICLPDPENPFVWYYVAFGFEHKMYKGGFFMGKIICPPEYPAKAPKVVVMTKNGRFHTWDNGICLSISDYHPEQWNPVWKVNQIVVGLVSFWIQSDYTYGAIEKYDADLGDMKSFEDWQLKLTMESRQHVLDHPKYKEIFAEYADAIGISEEPNFPEWDAHRAAYAEFYAKKAEEKRLAEEKARLEREEAEKAEALARAREERQRAKEAYAKAHPDRVFLKKLAELGLTKLIGQPAKLAAALKEIKEQKEAAPAPV